MKILFTSYNGLGYGGAEVSLLHLMKAVKRLGNDVYIASTDSFDGIKTIKFDKNNKFPYGSLDKKLQIIFEKIIKENKIDVIHANDRLTSVAAIKAGKKTGIRSVVHFRDYWFCCPNSTLINKNDKTYDANSYLDVIFNLPFNRVLINTYKYFYLKKARKVLNYADLKIAVSNIVLQKLFKHGVKGNLIVLNNGREIKISNVNHKKCKLFSIGFFGSFFKSKGVINLLEIMQRLNKKHKDIQLIAYGDGPLLDYCKSFVKKNSLNVIFKGRIPINEVNEAYKKLDLILLPSIWDEPFSGIPLEAGLNKIPIIASNKGGNVESIVDGFNGYLISPFDFKEWENKILKVYKNEKTRKILGINGLKMVKELFDIGKIAIKMEGYYRGLLK